MEQLLQYIWKYRLYRTTDMRTTQGEELEIIDPGIQNRDAGPDFFNAKVKINGTLWAGSVEIHQKASEWYKHGHDSDKAYDNVILHVIAEEDVQVFRNEEPITQWLMIIPQAIQNNIEWLLNRDGDITCFERLPEIASIHRREWMDRLLCERLERKTQDIYKWLDQYAQDWNEAFYILLCRNFGFGVNNDIFERLARSLPLKYIQKQRGSASQIEALFFGQAGMLEEASPKEFHHYYRFLQKEYQFLQKKFGLEPLESHLFRRLRVRPASSPYIKLAQLASIWVKHDTLFSALLNAGNLREIKSYLHADTSEFWDTHYNFRDSSPVRKKVLGDKALNIILINTVAPMMFAYGKYHHLTEYTERALTILERIPPEENHIINMFRYARIIAQNAGDTQALIQLKRNYCEQKKCLYCHFGFQLLKQL